MEEKLETRLLKAKSNGIIRKIFTTGLSYTLRTTRFHFTSDSTQPYPMFGWFIDDVNIYPRKLATSIADHQESNTPKQYELYANYPNPFNPMTTIRYTLPKSSTVSLTIFNLIGQEILALVDDTRPAGEYEVQWNASNLPSGLYVCKMQAGEFVATKKLVLLK